MVVNFFFLFSDTGDFREEDSPDYFRMAPGKLVGLMKVPYPVVATSYEKDPATGQVTLIHARYERPAEGAAPKKPKAYVFLALFLAAAILACSDTTKMC